MSFFTTLNRRMSLLRWHKTAATPVGASLQSASANQVLPDQHSTEQMPSHRTSLSHRLTTEMTVGQELFGVVSGIADYGVFVRFPNGESGLVYTSEVCWIGEDVTYNMGDKIKVMVLGFKAGRGLSLSIKRATIPDAFDAFMKATPVESVITGRIKSIQDYGVFVTVSPGVQGLLHVSDIADISIFSKASIGNPLDVVVVAVEVERMRVRLRAAP